MSKYTTGELAAICGVSVRTVQYYDTRGILVPSELSEGGRRLYSDADLQKMRVICYLREMDFSIPRIGELLAEENSVKVILLLLEEHEMGLRAELDDCRQKLVKLEELKRALKKEDGFTVNSIGDIAFRMKNKKQLKRLYALMLLTGIPVSALQWFSIIFWIKSGIWWPFAVWVGVAAVWGTLMSRYYFNSVAYICPECHNVFEPRLKEAFWANHTPRTRKLTCPGCGHRGFCVEVYREKKGEGK